MKHGSGLNDWLLKKKQFPIAHDSLIISQECFDDCFVTAQY